MTEIVKHLPTALTCSQFAIRGDSYFVDLALEQLIKGGTHDVLQIPQEDMQEGDYVFYTNRAGIPIHVAVVNADGKLLSKYYKDKNVYLHDVWEDIPDSDQYERYTVIRSK